MAAGHSIMTDVGGFGLTVEHVHCTVSKAVSPVLATEMAFVYSCALTTVDS